MTGAPAKLHARLAPSSAARWMSCPGSVRFCEEHALAGASSPAADEGTVCHALLEGYLDTGRLPPGDEMSVEGRPVVVTAEMREWVLQAGRAVVTLRDRYPGTVMHCEEPVEVGAAFGAPDDLWGTSDVLLVNARERLLTVLDAKFGHNEVDAVDNLQLALYGIGAAHLYGWAFSRIELGIIQPRSPEPVKLWTLDEAKLADLRERYAPRVRAALSPDAPRVPSDEACRWCPAAGVCPERQARALALAQVEFVHPTGLTQPQLLTLLKHAPRIREALKAAEEHARQLLSLGQALPGWKLVRGEKRRAWKDGDAALRKLTEMGYKPTQIVKSEPITPAQAEKLVGKARAGELAPLIEKPLGEPTLAPESDPRESLAGDFAHVPLAPHADLL